MITGVTSIAEATRLHTASSPLQLISHHDGSRKQHPLWWVKGLQLCITQIPQRLRATIVAIGISGQQHVLAPAKLWCDASTVAECEQILRSAGEQFCLSTVGCITTGFTAPKIGWVKNHQPHLYASLKTVMLPHDYLNLYLSGERVAECGGASGTGVLDIRNRTWSPEMLRAIDPDRDLSECFPRLIEAYQPASKILPAVAQHLGLSTDVIVSAGGGDNMMAAIGTGNVVEGRLTASMGTSGTLFAYSDSPVIDATGFLAAFCSSTGGWLPLICTMNCTVATEQLRMLFSIDVDKIDDMVAKVPPRCDGVLTLPFYNGGRSPKLPNGKAVIFGLDGSNTTQGHMIRSAMEAAVFGLKAGLLAFKKREMKFSEVTVTGGGSASVLWRQICADILNLRVRVLREKENAALGAALQALWFYKHTIGEKPSLQDLTTEHLLEDCEKGCMPGDGVAVYKEVYSPYLKVLETVSPYLKVLETVSLLFKNVG